MTHIVGVGAGVLVKSKDYNIEEEKYFVKHFHQIIIFTLPCKLKATNLPTGYKSKSSGMLKLSTRHLGVK